MQTNSFSITWKAHQRSLGRIVALKVLKPKLTSDENLLAASLQAARVVSRLKHPNLVQIFDVVTQPDLTYFVMECIDGPNTADLLAQRGTVSPAHVVSIAQAVASALDLAWREAGLVHRNIKPSTIYLDTRGVPKVSDIELAILVSDPRKGHPAVGAIAGTPNFLSPEQIQHTRPLDCRSDMYSLGATLYCLLTGHAPFSELDPLHVLQAQRTMQIPNPRQLNPRVSPGLSLVISRLMMKTPDDRFADWTEVLKNLSRVSMRKPPDSLQHQAISTVAPLPSSRKTSRGVGKNRFSFRPTSRLRRLLWMGLLIWLLWLGRQRWNHDSDEFPPTTRPRAAAGPD